MNDLEYMIRMYCHLIVLSRVVERKKKDDFERHEKKGKSNEKIESQRIKLSSTAK